MKRFLLSGALLAGVQILLRFVSVSFNAFVSRKIGAEAMGLFSLVMSVYSLAVTFAASGVNLAAVRLTAGALAHGKSPRAAVRGCVLYSLLFGCTTAAVLYVASPLVGSVLLGDGRTVSSLRALALSLPAISLSSALAGYFTGVRRVYKNAATQLLETFLRITVTAAVLTLFAPAGIEFACLAVVGGSAAAEAFSLLSAIVFYLFDRRPAANEKQSSAFAEVFRTAFPVAVGAYARQGLVTAEHLAIPWGLRKCGATSAAALAAYGTMQGMVWPLILFPAAVTGSFASLLVPEFAQCAERGEKERIRRMAEKVMQTALFFGIGVAGIFVGFSWEIGEGIYPGTDAADYLAVVAPLIPVMYLDTAVDGMLKGLGEQVHAMKINILDSAACLVLVLLLIPRFGITGYFIVQYVCELLNASLSLCRLLTVTGMRVRILRWVGLPILSVIGVSSIVRLFSAVPGIPLIGAAGSPAARILLVSAGYLLVLFFSCRIVKKPSFAEE